MRSGWSAWARLDDEWIRVNRTTAEVQRRPVERYKGPDPQDNDLTPRSHLAGIHQAQVRRAIRRTDSRASWIEANEWRFTEPI